MWLSLVERYVRDVEVAGSNPVTSTIRSILIGFEILENAPFFHACFSDLLPLKAVSSFPHATGVDE